MILNPTTDQECLGQLTHIARELAPTTLISTVARRLGTPRKVIAWLRSLPQSDDSGAERYRYIACDVSQRVRLLPDDPNCFERSLAALVLLETLDASTPRMLVTIDRPLRHTGVVEQRDGRWFALDLFPRRNFDWGEFGKDFLQGLHNYVGKPLLSIYGLGNLADVVGTAENEAIGRGKKKPEKEPEPPPKKPEPKTAEPHRTQPVAPRRQPAQVQARQWLVQRPTGGGGSEKGAGAQQTQREISSTKGGTSEKETRKSALVAAGATSAAADGDGGSQVGETGEETQRGVWGWPHE